jgi:hypothetical protein
MLMKIIKFLNGETTVEITYGYCNGVDRFNKTVETENYDVLTLMDDCGNVIQKLTN